MEREREIKGRVHVIPLLHWENMLDVIQSGLSHKGSDKQPVHSSKCNTRVSTTAYGAMATWWNIHVGIGRKGCESVPFTLKKKTKRSRQEQHIYDSTPWRRKQLKLLNWTLKIGRSATLVECRSLLTAIGRHSELEMSRKLWMPVSNTDQTVKHRARWVDLGNCCLVFDRVVSFYSLVKP